MDNRLFVGIDGGGTSCRARIRDANGQLLGEGKAGSANLQLGIDVAFDAVMQATEQATLAAGLSAADYARMHCGWALAAAEQPKEYAAMLAVAHPFAAINLDTDAYGACMGAFAGEDGAIQIAGTGSAGVLIENAKAIMIGGRGFPLSDQGSGAILGLRAIQRSLLAHDGILPASKLTQTIMQRWDEQADKVVEWAETAKPRDYGSLSPLVFEFANNNDAIAVELIQGIAADVTMLLNALVTKGAKQIALMGSVGQVIQPWLPPSIKAYLVAPRFDAQDGAIMMARRGAGLSPAW